MMNNGLPPIAQENATVLILGTFPGVQSLAEKRYYAHPRNLFWDIMNDICGAGRHLPYEERCEMLMTSRIAVWDVIASCERVGSADSRISQLVVNDFATFFLSHQCHTIYFNGKMAASLFARHVASTCLFDKQLITLPSTSPANAGISLEEKRCQWRQIVVHITS
jgi:hypoxanthine-DNA glycosylase